jgi:hypothetical protein
MDVAKAVYRIMHEAGRAFLDQRVLYIMKERAFMRHANLIHERVFSMLDFTPVREKTISMADLTRDLTREDLRRLTNEMIDTELAIISDATDADVVFVPSDPAANDTFGKPEETDLAWTLGHVVLHATASSEESAALSANLARGLIIDGRSRFEPDWRTLTTIAGARHRLEESRRMRQGFLDAWPDEPHLEMIQESPFYGSLTAVTRFVGGLSHEDSHLEQLREIMRQAKAARGA